MRKYLKALLERKSVPSDQSLFEVQHDACVSCSCWFCGERACSADYFGQVCVGLHPLSLFKVRVTRVLFGGHIDQNALRLISLGVSHQLVFRLRHFVIEGRGQLASCLRCLPSLSALLNGLTRNII